MFILSQNRMERLNWLVLENVTINGNIGLGIKKWGNTKKHPKVVLKQKRKLN